MKKKTGFDESLHKAKSVLSKTVDQIELFRKISLIRVNISSEKARIKDLKKQIGDYIFINRQHFENDAELKALIRKIQVLSEDIRQKEYQISDLKDFKTENNDQ